MMTMASTPASPPWAPATSYSCPSCSSIFEDDQRQNEKMHMDNTHCQRTHNNDSIVRKFADTILLIEPMCRNCSQKAFSSIAHESIEDMWVRARAYQLRVMDNRQDVIQSYAVPCITNTHTPRPAPAPDAERKYALVEYTNQQEIGEKRSNPLVLVRQFE
jgi:hypothetical protein